MHMWANGAVSFMGITHHMLRLLLDEQCLFILSCQLAVAAKNAECMCELSVGMTSFHDPDDCQALSLFMIM